MTYGWPKTIGLEEYRCNITKLYDEKPRTKTWGSSDCIRKVNESKCSWFMYSGHGGPTNNARIQLGSVTNSNFSSSNGTTGNYFIYISETCYPNRFHTSSDCINEQFLVKISNGAVATIGNAETGLLDDNSTDGFQQRTYRYTIDALYNPEKRIHHLDAMYNYGIQRCAPLMLDQTIYDSYYNGGMRFTIYSCDLLGDPALSVWTKKPVRMSKLPDYTMDGDKFTMTGIPPYTWVALANPSNDSIFTTQCTGFTRVADSSNFSVSDSNCVINDAVYKEYIKNNNKIKVIVKAHNYYSYSDTIDVIVSLDNRPYNSILSLNNLSFSGNTIKINYHLFASEFVTLSIFNSKGVLIKNLVNEKQAKGTQSVAFDKNLLGNGIYYYRLQAGKNQNFNKFVVTK